MKLISLNTTDLKMTFLHSIHDIMLLKILA